MTMVTPLLALIFAVTKADKVLKKAKGPTATQFATEKVKAAEAMLAAYLTANPQAV